MFDLKREFNNIILMPLKKEDSKLRRRIIVLFALAAWFFMLLINGAIPFLGVPALGQAVWTTGFSLSFIQESLLTIHASNFGNPSPAAIAFGLAGAYPAGLLISLGLHPSDAYSFMAAIWLTVAFWGAWKIGRLMGSTSFLALIGALLWTTLPVIWTHAGYSMLSLGIALLPFYFSTALMLLFKVIDNGKTTIIYIFCYFLVVVIAIFMDGYSYMMFAVGSSVMGCYILIRYKGSRHSLIKKAVPVHILSFGLSYGLFTLYIGKTSFYPAPLDFFRGWGLDLSFVAIPTRGVLWLWDILGLSIPRSDARFFGDDSVWMTTFSLPLVILGILAWVLTRKKARLATCFLLIALLGFYMALGPSLKINSTKPESLQIEKPNQASALMSADLAIAPTGNAFLSEHIPGFTNMRASYRWAALGMFGFWALIILLVAQKRKKNIQYMLIAMILFLIISNLPNLSLKWQAYTNNRSAFLKIDSELVDPLSEYLKSGEKVVFLPYQNDLLINYLAPKLGIKTFNIGGDKNLIEARENWPAIMQEFTLGQIDAGFSNRIARLLALGEVNAVVLPYDMLPAMQFWPGANLYQTQLEPITQVIQDFEMSELFEVERNIYYAVIRLNPIYNSEVGSENLLSRVSLEVPVPPFGLKLLNMDGNIYSNIYSQIGRIENGSIYTNGQSGYLIYGPYAPLNSGHYRLTIRGKADLIENAWVDVLSTINARQYIKIPLSSDNVNPTKNILISSELSLDEPVEDIEVRVFVSSSDIIRIDGYELVKITSDSKLME